MAAGAPWIALALLTALGPDSAPFAAGRPPRAPLPLRRFTLENGLQVAILPDADTPLVALHLQYNVGAAEDPADRPGVAHLFEHLMFGGSAHAPAGAFDTLLAAAGGDNNAWTDTDYTAYHLVVPKGALDLALFLESDRMGFLAAGLTDAELQNQLAVVAGEYGISADEPHGMDAEALALALWPADHPYHRGVLGQMGRLAAASRDELLAFHATWYRPDNASLALVGDVDPDVAEAAVRRWFGELPRPAAPLPARRTAAPFTRAAEERRVAFDEVDDATLTIAYPTVPAGHPDEAALDLLADLLSSGPGSRLDDALYYDHHRADSVSAWTQNDRLGGLFLIEVGRQEGALRPALSAVDRVLAQLAADPPRPSELDRQKIRWASYFLRAGTGLEDKAELLNTCQWLRGDPDCLAWDEARHLAVSADDLRRVAQTYLRADHRLLLSVVSPDEADQALPGSLPVEVW